MPRRRGGRNRFSPKRKEDAPLSPPPPLIEEDALPPPEEGAAVLFPNLRPSTPDWRPSEEPPATPDAPTDSGSLDYSPSLADRASVPPSPAGASGAFPGDRDGPADGSRAVSETSETSEILAEVDAALGSSRHVVFPRSTPSGNFLAAGAAASSASSAPSSASSPSSSRDGGAGSANFVSLAALEGADAPPPPRPGGRGWLRSWLFSRPAARDEAAEARGPRLRLDSPTGFGVRDEDELNRESGYTSLGSGVLTPGSRRPTPDRARPAPPTPPTPPGSEGGIGGLFSPCGCGGRRESGGGFFSPGSRRESSASRRSSG